MGYMVAFPKPTDQNNAPLPALMHLLLSIYSETVKVNKQHRRKGETLETAKRPVVARDKGGDRGTNQQSTGDF